MEANAPRAKYYEKNSFENCQPALNYGFAHPDPNHPWEQSVAAPDHEAVRREIRNIMAFSFDMGRGSIPTRYGVIAHQETTL